MKPKRKNRARFRFVAIRRFQVSMLVALLALFVTVLSLLGYELESIHVSNRLMDVTWFAEDNQRYLVQESPDLEDWITCPGLWTGRGDLFASRVPYILNEDPSVYVRLERLPEAPDLDTDYDGLSDWEEGTYLTDPSKADSDNDGVGDGEEVRLGKIPTDPSDGNGGPTPTSVALVPSTQNAPKVTALRDDRVITLELDFQPGNPWTPFDMGPDGVGAVGYKVTWFPIYDPSLTTSLVTSFRRVDIQPVMNETPYAILVQPVNKFGQLLPDSTEGVVSGGSDRRVQELRQEMTAFFDDFNVPEGLPNELKWNSAYSKPNEERFNGFFINKQFHAHTAVGTENAGQGDRAQTVHRMRKPLVIETGITRRIVFDLDTADGGGRAIWYLDVLPVVVDMTSHFAITGGAASHQGHPANGLRFRIMNQEVSVWGFDESGRQNLIADTRNLDWAGRELFINVRRHWEILLSDTHAQIRVDNQTVLDTELSAFSLHAGDYTCHWNGFGYNTMKNNFPYYVFHWDNFGFDGPQRAADRVLHNYRTTVMGTDYVESSANTPATVSVYVPDDLAPLGTNGKAYATLCFTMQMDTFAPYKPAVTDQVLVNGVPYPIPLPESGTIPPISDASALINVNAPFGQRIPIGTLTSDSVAPLQTGLNEITFVANQCGFHNVHVEVDYMVTEAPSYTLPEKIHPVIIHSHYPSVGLPSAIYAIGPHEVQTWRDHLHDPAVFNPTVSGVIEVGVTVNAGLFGNDGRRLEANYPSACLRAHGVNPGVQSVGLWLRPDNPDSQAQLIARLNTSVQCPAPQVVHTFVFDTTSFTNGTYELTVSAVDSRGVETVPAYSHAGQQAGSLEAYNGFYFPLHITIAN